MHIENMASNPMGKCCYQGVVHEGTPTGTLETIGDFEAYIAKPKDSKVDKGIVIIPDVIGHRLVNAQLIADNFADNGYHVIMPDPFYGDSIKMNEIMNIDFAKWTEGGYSDKKIAHTPDVVDPIIKLCIQTLREKHGCKKIGGVGYCFGAKYVVRHLNPQSGGFDVGYSAHPSFVELSELEAITGPYSIAAAEEDHIFPKEKRDVTESTLVKLGLPFQLNVFGGVAHGFAVRGGQTTDQQIYAKEAAFLQAVQFFERFLK